MRSSPSLSSLSTLTCLPVLFWHFSSQEPHMSVHFRLCLLQEQLIVMQLPLQPHLISSRTALGAGRRVVGIAWSRLPTWLHPWDVGAGRSGCGVPRFFQTNATQLARLITCSRAAFVGGNFSSEYCLLLHKFWSGLRARTAGTCIALAAQSLRQ